MPIPSLTSQSSSSSGLNASGDTGSYGERTLKAGSSTAAGLFNNTGIQFGNKGIDPLYIGAGVLAVLAFFYFKK